MIKIDIIPIGFSGVTGRDITDGASLPKKHIINNELEILQKYEKDFKLISILQSITTTPIINKYNTEAIPTLITTIVYTIVYETTTIEEEVE